MRGSLRAVVLLLAVPLALVARPASAQAPSSGAIRAIEQLYLDSSYDEALRECQTALRNPRLSPRDRQEVLKYVGTIYFAQDNASEARAAFVRILRNDPAYRLPSDWPPRIVEFFERLRGDLLPPPRIRHTPPAGFRLGTPIVVPAQLLFLADNHRPRLHYRIEGSREFSVVDMDREDGDQYSGIVPTSPAMSPDRDTQIEYFITVEDGQRVLANAGTQDLPLRFPVGRVAGTGGRTPGTTAPGGGGGAPWALIGVGTLVAVGLGVGAYFLLGSTTGDETGAVDINVALPE